MRDLAQRFRRFTYSWNLPRVERCSRGIIVTTLAAAVLLCYSLALCPQAEPKKERSNET
jgi:hypothetical protein